MPTLSIRLMWMSVTTFWYRSNRTRPWGRLDVHLAQRLDEPRRVFDVAARRADGLVDRRHRRVVNAAGEPGSRPNFDRKAWTNFRLRGVSSGVLS